MRIVLLFSILMSISFFSSCWGSGDTNTNSQENNANIYNATDGPKPVPSESRALGSDITTPTPVPTVEAVTLKPLIDEYCKARKANDEAALRKLYTAATVKSLLSEASKEGKNSITSYLQSEPIGDTCTVVNERIVGDTGEATVITKTYKNGIRWTFIKENGSWKLTDQSSDFDKVKKGN